VEDPDESSTKDLAHLLYDTALLASGFVQDDTEGFSARMYRTIASSLNIKSLNLVEEMEVDDEEEEAAAADEPEESSSDDKDEL
jgi:heat shock protein beta